MPNSLRGAGSMSSPSRLNAALPSSTTRRPRAWCTPALVGHMTGTEPVGPLDQAHAGAGLDDRDVQAAVVIVGCVHLRAAAEVTGPGHDHLPRAAGEEFLVVARDPARERGRGRAGAHRAQRVGQRPECLLQRRGGARGGHRQARVGRVHERAAVLAAQVQRAQVAAADGQRARPVEILRHAGRAGEVVGRAGGQHRQRDPQPAGALGGGRHAAVAAGHHQPLGPVHIDQLGAQIGQPPLQRPRVGAAAGLGVGP